MTEEQWLKKGLFVISLEKNWKARKVERSSRASNDFKAYHYFRTFLLASIENITSF